MSNNAHQLDSATSLTFYEYRSEVFETLHYLYHWQEGGNVHLFEKQEEIIRTAYYGGEPVAKAVEEVFERTIRRYMQFLEA